MTQYWLMKSEPDEYGWDDLTRDGETKWSGVRNFAAAKNMRAMEKGDLAFFYHSRTGLAVVGIMEITRSHYPDPSADNDKFVLVDVRPVKALVRPVPLQEIKANPKLSDMALVKQSRLSVSPVSAAQWVEIIAMAEK
ncbi:EVE domain-containing protein [Sphingorhabdus arenilitoris]|uniref:EVE domain-containing protein n=1 Tax=Sphingorhabdus arenilitoris TaxID=1490041 RepID=A0ABV8RF16_9SPHN